MIDIYASRLDEQPAERYRTRVAQTVLEWLHKHGISQDALVDQLPMSVYLNGERLLPSQWHKVKFAPADTVEIYREPKGADPFTITFALIAAAVAASVILRPKIPSLKTGGNAGTGEALQEASAKGNKAKVNDIRPECAGFNPARYPDYLIPPRRYFAAPQSQRIEMCLAVGIGRYQIPLGRVKVGQTALVSLGADANFSIYEPGADLSADPAHLFWYSAPEVGASSNGTAGLELTLSSALTGQATASVFQFVDDTINIPTGAGAFPVDWVSGLVLRVIAPYPYTVADGTGDGGRDVITGDIASLGLAVGDSIEIAGTNAGFYIVHSLTATQLQLDYAGGTPASGLVLGDLSMAIGFKGLQYRILVKADQGLQVERLNATGAVDADWSGWENISSNAAQVLLDASNLEGGYRGPFPACPEGEVVEQIEWDIFFPEGLTGYGREGQQYVIGGYYSIEWRDMAMGGTWTAATNAHTNNVLNQVGYTTRLTLPYAMRPEVRIKKLFVSQGGYSTSEYKDKMMWYGLKGLMRTSSPVAYEGMTVMTADIRGGDRISTQSESLISVECTRILPVLRGGAWAAEQPTREISAWVGYLVRSVGYSDTDDLDVAELEYLEQTYWTPRGDFYDKIISASSTVKECLIEVLRAGFSEFTVDRGVITPVRDQPRGIVFDHVYNPQVMTDALAYDFSAPDQPDDFDGVDVTYFSNLTRQDETIQCRLDGDLGERAEKITVGGVTDEARAWRIGMRQRRGHVYRQKQYSFKTELDALNSSYLDYVALGVRTPGYGQSAFIRGYVQMGDTVLIESSEAFDWTLPGRYKVVVRRRDGTAAGPFIATRIDDSRFTIPSQDFVYDMGGVPELDGPSEPPFLQFGHEDKWCFPALIQSISPSGTKTCSVKAVNYDERMYLDDDNFPPA